jgi:hypothetical protein
MRLLLGLMSDLMGDWGRSVLRSYVLLGVLNDLLLLLGLLVELRSSVVLSQLMGELGSRLMLRMRDLLDEL